MSIQQQVELRYFTAGHIRFDIPEILCLSAQAEQIEMALGEMEGIYRVDLYPNQGKLSIRYIDSICDFRAIVKYLYDFLSKIKFSRDLSDRDKSQATKRVAPQVKRKALSDRFSETRFGAWLQAKKEEMKETLQAAKVMIKRGIKRSAGSGGPSSWMTEFATDLLVLYLIKIHWHRVVHQWLVTPWKHRYELLSSFYMVYLLVHSRTVKMA